MAAIGRMTQKPKLMDRGSSRLLSRGFFLRLVSSHVNLNLVLQNVLWLPSLQAFSSLVKGLYRNIDIRKYIFLTIDEMFLHSNLFHTMWIDR